MVGYLVAYAALGTLCTTWGFGRRLMRLTFQVLQREADLRFALVRVRENAEAVAFYRGEGREAAGAVARLRAAVEATYRKVAWESGLALWTNAYSFATILVPSMLMAPKYFAGEVRFGTISQVRGREGRGGIPPPPASSDRLVALALMRRPGSLTPVSLLLLPGQLRVQPD